MRCSIGAQQIVLPLKLCNPALLIESTLQGFSQAYLLRVSNMNFRGPSRRLNLHMVPIVNSC